MKTKWNLKLLYSDIEDENIQKDIQTSIQECKKFVKDWKSNKAYLKDPKTLLKALQQYEKVIRDPGICTRPSYFLFLNKVLDQENPIYKAKENKLNDISLEIENSIQFFTLSISKIPKKNQKIFLESNILKPYNHFLKTLFNISKYTLSNKEEKIFNLKSKTSYSNWVNMVSELQSKQTFKVKDEKGKYKNIPYGEISKYLDSQQKEVREYAAKQFYKVNSKYSEIVEFEINSILENKKINDTYRKIPTPQTTRFLHDDMDESTVKALQDAVTNSFDISKRYYILKAKLLKQKKLAYYERNVPIGNVKDDFTVEDSFKIVLDVFKKLDPEFESFLKTYIKEGRYDIYPKKGKESGAFCIAIGDRYPIYILLNHENRLKDILTIAHESGHALHAQYSFTQSPLNQGHSTACAEVASTFFEDFTLDEISKQIPKEKKDLMLLKSLEEDISSIFRQIACYNFELSLHTKYKEKGFLSQKDISNIFVEQMYKYLGDSVNKDMHMQMGWTYWSHIRNFFYTYTYSSGLLISKYLQARVRENPKDISLVKEFLKSGNSKSPKEIFLDMGIDISKREFWEKGLLQTRHNLEYLEDIYLKK